LTTQHNRHSFLKTRPIHLQQQTSIYTNPLAAPTHVPAIAPKQQKEATRATQQQQADLPPGKALHFVDIKEDGVGPCGIEVDPERQFTRKHLTEYHPNATDFPKRVQEDILEAHQIFNPNPNPNPNTA
jgi:hypothetical protein